MLGFWDMCYMLAQVIARLSILQSTGPLPVPMDMDMIHSQSRIYEQMMSTMMNMVGSNALWPSPLVASNASDRLASQSQAPFMEFSFPNDNNHTYNTSVTTNNHTFSDADFGFLPSPSDNFIKGSSGRLRKNYQPMYCSIFGDVSSEGWIWICKTIVRISEVHSSNY